MVGVAGRCPDADAPACESLHRAETNVGFLASVLAQVLRYQPHQRARGATVGLLRRQGDLYDVSFRHFVWGFLTRMSQNYMANYMAIICFLFHTNCHELRMNFHKFPENGRFWLGRDFI